MGRLEKLCLDWYQPPSSAPRDIPLLWTSLQKASPGLRDIQFRKTSRPAGYVQCRPFRILARHNELLVEAAKFVLSPHATSHAVLNNLVKLAEIDDEYRPNETNFNLEEPEDEVARIRSSDNSGVPVSLAAIFVIVRCKLVQELVGGAITVAPQTRAPPPSARKAKRKKRQADIADKKPRQAAMVDLADQARESLMFSS